MSHIAEVYAKELGVKIGRPTITEHFIPGLPDKFITLHSSNKCPGSLYKYWNLVIHLIKPHLDKVGFKIVQIGGPQDVKVQGADVIMLGASFKQMNYIMSKSEGHVGTDSLPGHLAGFYDVPSVILHFNLYKENSKPLWYKKNSCLSLEPDFSKTKPTYSPVDSRIQEIKAELIAQSLLDQLNIEEKINFKTLHVGEAFNNDVIEVIPNDFKVFGFMKNKNIIIRGDVHYDEDVIHSYLKILPSALHINQKYPLEKCTGNIKHLVYEINEDTEDLNAYFKNFKRNKINIIIRTRNKEILDDLRLKYFDYVVDYIDLSKWDSLKVTENTKYLSSKLVCSNGEVYKSIYSAKKLDKTDNICLNNDSIEELFQLYLYE